MGVIVSPDQFIQSFVPAFLGALFVKLLDLAASRFQKRQSRKEGNISKLLDLLTDYGELVQLYRFRANVSSSLVQDEAGNYVKDNNNKYAVESNVLEPEPQFEAAIKDLSGADIKSAITRKIAEIRLKTAEAQDIAHIIDPSGHLENQLNQLYLDTIYSIQLVIKYKDKSDAYDTFTKMGEALKEADDTRRDIRVELQAYLNK